MRTIKFRGKRLDNGEWMYGYVLHCDNYTDIWTAEEGFYREEVDPDTVGQFTGLYDINGKEIYEGDILETEKYGVVEVIFANAMFETHYFLKDGNEHRIPFYAVGTMTVIGNIHDNPELLKGGEE